MEFIDPKVTDSNWIKLNIVHLLWVNQHFTHKHERIITFYSSLEISKL